MSHTSDNIQSRYPLKDSSNYGNLLELTPSKSKTNLVLRFQLLRILHLKACLLSRNQKHHLQPQ